MRGVVELTHLALPHLVKTKGCIINNSSIAALRTFKNFLIYCMTKAALDQFTKCVAMEVADRGVRVNSINPGFIDTDFQTKVRGIERDGEEYAAVLEGKGANSPIGRYGGKEFVISRKATIFH